MENDFNGGYIVARVEAYDLLIEAYVPQKGTKQMLNGYLRVSDGMIIDENIHNIKELGLKQFYINNDKLSWNIPKLSIMSKEEAKEFPAERNMYDVFKQFVSNYSNPLSRKEFALMAQRLLRDDEAKTSFIEDDLTISITDDNGVVYEFEKPSFECELLKYDKENSITYGVIKENEAFYSMEWNCKGDSILSNNGRNHQNYNLKPIKKQWYENKNNFKNGVVLFKDYIRMSEKFTNFIINTKIVFDKSNFLKAEKDKWRLLTKEEIDSLHYEGK